jgi:diguanylate cyclase (GGDEF)-like protein
MKILIAEDSPTSLALLNHSLRKLHHEVIAAKSGKEAIERYHETRPDLIILDVLMEGMDGFETAKQIRMMDPEDWIPIIFLSASVDDESIAKGISAGGDDYLAKPFSDITLAAKIQAMQRISDMRQKLYEMTLKLSVLSSTDALTGVYNRFQFDKILPEMIAQSKRNHRVFALLFIDLDHFKKINDELGHHVGDELLRSVAGRLKHCLRINDLIARMGGDEFAILISDISTEEDAARIAAKIIDQLEPPHDLAEKKIHMHSSIGIVLYPVDGANPTELMSRADKAMYEAKKLGRNNFQFYHHVKVI